MSTYCVRRGQWPRIPRPGSESTARCLFLFEGKRVGRRMSSFHVPKLMRKEQLSLWVFVCVFVMLACKPFCFKLTSSKWLHGNTQWRSCLQVMLQAMLPFSTQNPFVGWDFFNSADGSTDDGSIGVWRLDHVLTSGVLLWCQRCVGWVSPTHAEHSTLKSQLNGPNSRRLLLWLANDWHICCRESLWWPVDSFNLFSLLADVVLVAVGSSVQIYG